MLAFPEALKLLAERNGIPMPKRAEYADAETRLRGAVYQIQELAQEAFPRATGRAGGSRGAALSGKTRSISGGECAIRAGLRGPLRPFAAAHFGEAAIHGRADWKTPDCWAAEKTAVSTTVSATG